MSIYIDHSTATNAHIQDIEQHQQLMRVIQLRATNRIRLLQSIQWWLRKPNQTNQSTKHS